MTGKTFQGSLKQFLSRPIGAAIVGLSVILLLHLALPSYMNGARKNPNLDVHALWQSHFAEQVYHDRLTVSEFARRPLTLGIQGILHDHFNIPYQFSFNLVVLFSLFGSCICLSKIATVLGGAEAPSYLAVYAFLFSFTTLFGFLGPMHTYDEPLQFFLLLISFYLLLKDNIIASVIVFSTASIARETSLLLLPFFVYHSHVTKRLPFYVSALWIAPILIYFLHFIYFLDSGIQQQSIAFNSGHRFTGWTENFRTVRSAVTSITNPFVVAGLPLIVLIRYFSKLSKENKTMVWWAAVFIVINTSVVFISGLAKEPRLFATPLVLLWPLLTDALAAAYQHGKVIVRNHTAVFIGILTLSGLYSLWLYHPVEARVGIIFQLYLFVSLTFFLVLLYAIKVETREISKVKLPR